MTGPSTFLVTLHPDIDWHNATGKIDQWWNGTGAVSMVTTGGAQMDGFVYEGCNIITAGKNSGDWLRAGATTPPTPSPTTPPPSPTHHTDVDVVWDTPSTNGVLGSMPLGNGKLGVNIWAEQDSTVGILLSHVDALDENSNLAKLGRVKVRVLPASMQRTSSPESLSSSYAIHPGYIGGQPPLKDISCPNHTICPALAAAACDATPGCTGYGLCPIYSDGMHAELFTSAYPGGAAYNKWWTLWQKAGSPPPGPPVHTKVHDTSLSIALPS
jgi:hypothetical protein